MRYHLLPYTNCLPHPAFCLPQPATTYLPPPSSSLPFCTIYHILYLLPTYRLAFCACHHARYFCTHSAPRPLRARAAARRRVAAAAPPWWAVNATSLPCHYDVCCVCLYYVCVVYAYGRGVHTLFLTHCCSSSNVLLLL